MTVECQECLRVSMAAFGNVWDMSWVICGYLGISEGVWGCLRGVGGCRWAEGGVWQSFPFNFLQFQEVTNEILDILQQTRRSQMSHISKCPNVTDVLTYWEALGEVSEPSYKSLLYFSSIGSYCITLTSYFNQCMQFWCGLYLRFQVD